LEHWLNDAILPTYSDESMNKNRAD
jgi:hypothetical protein